MNLAGLPFICPHGVATPNLFNSFSKDEQFGRAAKDESTLLHQAVQGDRKDIVKLLLYKGADPDGEDNLQNTPQFQVVFWGRKEIIPLLLARGADPRHKDKMEPLP